MTEKQQIQKGFNAGYIIAKHKPDLAKIMQNGFVEKEKPYALGFIAGAKEYGREATKSRLKNYNFKPLPKNPKSAHKEKGKDKDARDI